MPRHHRIGPVYVYALVDPRTNKRRYVGQSKDPAFRLKAHITVATNETDYRKTEFQFWIADVVKAGLTPTISILDETDSDNAEPREKKWIAFLLSNGDPLLNCQNGDCKYKNYIGPDWREKIEQYRAAGHEGMVNAICESVAMRLRWGAQI